jgi:hypothetical protein
MNIGAVDDFCEEILSGDALAGQWNCQQGQQEKEAFFHRVTPLGLVRLYRVCRRAS